MRGALLRALPAILWAGTASWGAPAVGDEFELSAPSLISWKGATPSMAEGAGVVMVVWQDNRTDANARRLYAARFDSSGNLLDPTGIEISGKRNGYLPHVSFDGTQFMVLWQPDSWGGGVFLTRVSPAGVVLNEMPLTIAPGRYTHSGRGVCEAGRCLISWQDDRAEILGDLYAGWWDPASATLSPAGGFLLSGGTWQQGLPELAFDGTRFLVVWLAAIDNRQPFRLRAGLLAPGGTAFMSNVVLTNTAQLDLGIGIARVAFDGTNFVAVWSDARNVATSGLDIYGARIATTGALLDPTGIPLSTEPGNQVTPDVGVDSVGAVVAWSDLNGPFPVVRGVHVSTAGSVANPSRPLTNLTEGQAWPALTGFSSGGWAAVAADSIRVLKVDLAAPSAGTVASQSATPQGSPSTAVVQGRFLVSWAERGPSDWDIKAAWVDQDARVSTFVVCQESGDQTAPEVTCNASRCLVGWSDRRSGTTSEAYAARVDPVVGVLDPRGFRLTTAPIQGLAVGTDGVGFLGTWTLNDSAEDLHGGRIDFNGALLDGVTGFPISQAADAQRSAAIAFSEGTYVVAWTDSRPGFTSSIRAARVSPAGLVVDPQGLPIASTPVATPPTVQVVGPTVTIASAGSSDARWSTFTLDGGLIADGGAVAGGQSVKLLRVGDALHLFASPISIAADTASLIVTPLASPDAGAVLATYDGSDSLGAHAQAVDGTRGLLTYARLDHRVGYGMWRVRARLFDFSPDGGALGPFDGGVTDGGVTDGGATDGGQVGDGVRHLQVGCACSSGEWVMALGLLVGLGRRNSRHRPDSCAVMTDSWTASRR